MRNFAIITALLFLTVSAADAPAAENDIFELYCNVDFAYEGDETLTLFNLPDGTGRPFSEARLSDGTSVDATLRVQLYLWEMDPIPDYPAEDMWLESSDMGMVFCTQGTAADMTTDENGWTIWALPLKAGGWSTAQCRLVISGLTPVGWEDLNLQFNSADISGDGIVNLNDVGIFSSRYFGTYDFAADFYWDGVLNLQDVGLLATGIGTNCP